MKNGKTVNLFLNIGIIITVLLYASRAMATPSVQDIEILSIQANGTGCPVDSTTELVVDTKGDGTADFFQVTFSEFFVEKPGIPVKNCIVEVLLQIPQGWRFSVVNVSYEGYASLSNWVTGNLSTKYEFPFFSNEVTTNTSLERGFEGPYEKEDTLGLFTGVYSPCGILAPLNMNSRLVLVGPNFGYSYMGIERQSGLLTQIWALQWKKC